MSGFYVPTTAKVIRRRDLGLKPHLKDWRCPAGSKQRPLVYKARSFTTTQKMHLYQHVKEHVLTHQTLDRFHSFVVHETKIIHCFYAHQEPTRGAMFPFLVSLNLNIGLCEDVSLLRGLTEQPTKCFVPLRKLRARLAP